MYVLTENAVSVSAKFVGYVCLTAADRRSTLPLAFQLTTCVKLDHCRSFPFFLLSGKKECRVNDKKPRADQLKAHYIST